ncbi:MAG: Fic family protein [Syntrophorhabdaceae bacterium]|nr:Fic family protein [Syntrophorhabdaceae bacterium]
MKKKLGFTYSPNDLAIDLPEPNRDQAIFRVRKLFPEFVWDTTALEGNPFTFPEVKTLLEGVTVGGHRVEDEVQVLNQAKSWKRLIDMVKDGNFSLDREVFCKLNGIVAREEALEWGTFRKGGVGIAGTNFKPPAYQELDSLFERGATFINGISNTAEKGMVFYLFGALNQFFYDGNKRTSRLMMNGVLLTDGYDVISVPARQRLEYNEKMIRFYDTLDGTEMMSFLLDCSTLRSPAPTSTVIQG